MKQRIYRIRFKGTANTAVVAGAKASVEGRHLLVFDDAGCLVAEFRASEVLGWSSDVAPVGPQRYGWRRRMELRADEEE